MPHDRWQFWIDRGGTFTDCVALDPTGRLSVTKVPSSDHAPLVGIRRLLGLQASDPIPRCEVRMGTTIATNALLERSGARSALVITRGFGDLLAIGTQARPELFELDIRKPEVLHEAVLEVDARLDKNGQVLARPDLEQFRTDLERFVQTGIQSVGIVVLHAYADGALEQELAHVARAAGARYVAVSHEVAGELGLLNRAGTTALDAYLTPGIQSYVAALVRELGENPLRIMQSSGGLTEAAAFRGHNAILSGPAGGVVAYARLSAALGYARVIGFDMGGTSTDVSRFDGRHELVYETELSGVRVAAPMLRLHTVAAGGGSICRFDGARFTVGPDSAGADPGPLCYGRPGARDLTISDVNLLLGRLQQDRFPLPLATERTRAALEELAGRVSDAGTPLSPEQVAEGLLEIANVDMAEAIRKVTVACGRDVRDYALFVFGGAGGQHACALARKLGIRTILFHALSGVLSAFGMGLADRSWHGHADAGRVPLTDGALERLGAAYERLERSGRAVLADGEFAVQRRVELRYRGAEATLTLEFATATTLAAAFHAEHARSFGHHRPDHPIEIVQIRIELVVAGSMPEFETTPDATPGSSRSTRLWHAGKWLLDVPVLHREQLRTGDRLAGPLLVLEATSTIVIEPGFDLEVKDAHTLVAHDNDRGRRSAPSLGRADRPDPIALEVMGNLFMSIAEQMGNTLQRTALSTNIRERLDYSCAVFGKNGDIVANAPHIPVHLGAMSESVRAILAAHPELAPGDVFATNDPSQGGSHLPDVTVVAPVHDERGDLLFFTASRGHHADIGGITPGSMPPFSRELHQEGVVLRALRIVQGGRLDSAAIHDALTRGAYPARDPATNLADIEAQVAACAAGKRLLLDLVAGYGLDFVARYMGFVQDDVAEKVRAALRRLGDGARQFEDALDDGTPLRVTLRLSQGSLVVDFSGSGGEHPGNLNAPRAVTLAALIYTLRCLVAARIPLNSGCLAPVTVRLPDRSIVNPGPGRAVVAGNVETSQRIVDVLLAAFGKAAASQGTMNNLSFGNERFGYYETIAGGAGAGDGFAGASAVHTHMTNTRITDAEVLESRYPVRLLEFSIRRGSGGAGRHAGGDGVVRELLFLTPLSVAVLSERRSRAPFGLCGGEPGRTGRNTLNGRDIGGKAELSVAAGDRLRIETPGGGGYGRVT